MNMNDFKLNTQVAKNNRLLLGNVKKEIDTSMKDEMLAEHWKNRRFYEIDECRIDLRREVIKKCFRL